MASTWDGQPIPPDEQVRLAVEVADRLSVRVDAPFHDDPAPSAPAGSTWRLWEHEVVEVFLVGDDERYLEVELGPWGHHLALALHGVRRIVRRHLPVELTGPVRARGRWSVEAALDRSLVPTGSLRGNAYAIHGVGAARRHLAWWPVPGPEPDFHRLDELPALPGPARFPGADAPRGP